MAHRLNSRLVIILAILLAGGWLRFYQISNIPPGIIQDEAAIGYNSYSIAETGKDEYGQVLPLAFRSFGDYKLPLYLYASAIPIKLLGLSIFTMRLVSALSGSLSILMVYLVIKEMFGERQAIFGMGMFAITPWSVFFSRGGHEANLGLFILLVGLWTQLVAFKKNRLGLLLVSATMFALTTYAYISFKFISPLVFGANFLIFRWKIKQTIIAFIVFLILAAPQYYLMRFAAGSNRITSLYDSQRILPRYVSYFSPRSLFFAPDPDGNKSYPDLSAFYPWMVVPYLVGLFFLFGTKTSRGKLAFLAIFALSPLPAAIAKDPFSNIRALPLVFPVSVVVGLGLDWLRSRLPSRVRLVVVIVLLTTTASALYRNNFVLLPHERYLDWVYGYQQIVSVIKKDYPAAQVLLNDPRGVYYAELLFFSNYSPQTYQKENLAAPLPNYYNNVDFDPHHRFGNFETRAIDWTKDSVVDQIIVSMPLGISEIQAQEHFLEKVFTITGPDGQTVFTGYKTHPDIKIESNQRNARSI